MAIIGGGGLAEKTYTGSAHIRRGEEGYSGFTMRWARRSLGACAAPCYKLKR